MITIRKSEERGHVNHGWLDSHFTFSFADYYDPQHMGFRALRVINDDVIAGGGGFGTHPHRDMEIITYILSGALEHKDSMGNGRVIRPGEIQYMAAGTGVQHSEFNHSQTEPAHLLQIWILPDRKGAKPNYAEKSLAKAEGGTLHLAASKSGRENSIVINQDADVFAGKFKAGDKINYLFKPGRHGWLHVAEGEIELNNLKLKSGDAAAFSDEKEMSFTAKSPTQILFFDLN
ncbi:MAG TPA: pirin family protein [Candidatus Saccharimonadales bacterium]|nr:pirin family protein [Candidatus Baltobacteraceae bacterium]HUA66938.1 pirin family protein [Candidatus Saccharimonadales bacterium]